MNDHTPILQNYLKTFVFSKSEEITTPESDNVPVQLSYNDQSGRFLIAAREIKQGEVLWKETAPVIAPKAGSGPNCLDCCLPFSETDWPGCRDCGMPRCFPNCHGTMHSKEECDVIRNWNCDFKCNLPLVKQVNVVLTTLRTYLYCKHHSYMRKVIEGLQSNKDRRRLTTIGRFIDSYVVKFLSNHDVEIDSDFVHQICGVFDTNAFEISWKNNIKARALLPAGALMNHSCMPNTQHWFYENQCVVKASVDILKGDPITNTYTQTLWGTKARQDHLRMTKLFICSCERCLDPTELGTHLSSIKCSECDSYITMSNDSKWECTNCTNAVNNKQVQVWLQVASSIAASAKTLDAFSLFKSINKLQTFLGLQHYVVTELYFTYIQLISTDCVSQTSDHLHTVHTLATELLDIISKLEPGHSKLRGLLLYYRSRIFGEIYSRKDTKSSTICVLKEELYGELLQAVLDAEKSYDILQYDSEFDGVESTKLYLTNLKNMTVPDKIS